MHTLIALLRGINVGGRNKLPMRDLVAILEGLGLRGARTVVQSGNAAFETDEPDAAALAASIGAAIGRARGFEPRVLVLRAQELAAAVTANPFPEATAEPKTLHLSFLASEPTAPDLDRLTALRRDGERFELQGRVFWLHAPAGIGKSKLAASVERVLGVDTTSRNWRTVQRILALATHAPG